MADLSSKQTILVVEDETPIRLLIEAVLQREGYNLVIASDGDEATSALLSNDQSIDLLLTDLSIPGRQGDEVALLARDSNPGIKVVFASGSFGQAPFDLVERISGAVFLPKPYTPRELLKAIATAFHCGENELVSVIAA